MAKERDQKEDKSHVYQGRSGSFEALSTSVEGGEIGH